MKKSTFEKEIEFCFRIVMTYCEQKNLDIKKNFCKFSAFSFEFAKLLKRLEQFIWTVKSKTIFEKEYFLTFFLKVS